MELRQVIATRLEAHLTTQRVLGIPQIAMVIAELSWVLRQVDAAMVEPALGATPLLDLTGGPLPACRPDRDHAWLLHRKYLAGGDLAYEKNIKTCRWCAHSRPMTHSDKVVAGIAKHHPRPGAEDFVDCAAGD